MGDMWWWCSKPFLLEEWVSITTSFDVCFDGDVLARVKTEIGVWNCPYCNGQNNFVKL